MSDQVCPTCEGSKYQTITSRTFTAKGWEENPPVRITCQVCDGTGLMTPTMQAAKDAWDNVWYRCEKSPDSYYVPDGVSPECSKHHYRCIICHKITQIG